MLSWNGKWVGTVVHVYVQTCMSSIIGTDSQRRRELVDGDRKRHSGPHGKNVPTVAAMPQIGWHVDPPV